MTVFKYPVSLVDTFNLGLPVGAEILYIDTQGGAPMLWARIDETAEVEKRTFHLRGTGHVFTGEEGKHVGSFQMHGGGLVFHLFETA